jgi:hypothetical protein
MPNTQMYCTPRNGGSNCHHGSKEITYVLLRGINIKISKYQRVISLEIQIGITSQINKWPKIDPPDIQEVWPGA